jgi:hygromycin-B 4-O-kinase
MRTADVSSTVGYGMWDRHGRAPFASWQEWLLDAAHDRPGGRVSGWRERLARSPIGDGAFNEAVERLRRLVDACPGDRHLVHTDLLNRNVFIEGDRVAGVIDWGNAMYGDFVYELAGITFWTPWFRQWRDIDFADEARGHYAAIGLDVPRFEQRLACYELQVGIMGCAYNAFLERWSDLEWTTRRTRDVLARLE